MKHTKEQCEKKIEKYQDKYLKWEFRLKNIKPELEVGKWYRDSRDESNNILLSFKKDNLCFGFDLSNNYGEYYLYDKSHIMPATEKEVEEALIKEAKKRGFKEGVDVKWSSLDNVWRKLHGEFIYCPDLNTLFLGTHSIFKDGEWAEIIEEPVYEYQWLVEYKGREGKFVTGVYYTKPSEIIEKRCEGYKVYSRIEETKRIRK